MIYRVSQKNVYVFGGLSNKKYRGGGLIFKSEILICQSKANLDEKILFCKVTRVLDPEVRKMPVNGKFGNEASTFHSDP